MEHNTGITDIAEIFHRIRSRVSEFIVGHQELAELIFIALVSRGHILIEGVPGTAKTTIVKAISRLAGCQYGRVQCAMDVQPADITGVRVFNRGRGDFELKKGPIFTNILLIDEINRITPKTQSAFIEAMSELQVTIDGITIPLHSPFFVVATQNPYELEGTFPLIEAQKDRFMLSSIASHLDGEEELEVIRREDSGLLEWENFFEGLRPITTAERINCISTELQQVRMEEPVRRYIRDLVMATRRHQDIALGASTRASIAFVRAGKSLAALQGRDYVLPDDVKRLSLPVLQHRLVLKREAEIAGITTAGVIEELLRTVEVP
ncbi:MAG: MoxR family ATPase [Methanomicrobiales archaeon]|nr:MoxR family ATPase [Methanomicrobiales archaeon]